MEIMIGTFKIFFGGTLSRFLSAQSAYSTICVPIFAFNLPSLS
jgi:hypothetical protein